MSSVQVRRLTLEFSLKLTNIWAVLQFLTKNSMEEALRQQTISRLQKKQQTTVDEMAGDSSSAMPERNTSSASINSLESQPAIVAPSAADIELVFKPYPGQGGSGDASDTRYIKTTVNATSK